MTMRKIGFLLALALLMSVAAFGATFTINNTGLGTAGAVDSFWSITSPSAGSAYKVTGSPSSYPFPVWSSDNATSGWIAPQPTYVTTTPGTKDASGAWVFTTTFSLTGLDPTTAIIAGRWQADDQGSNITLNGHALSLTTPLDQFVSWTSFSIGAGSYLRRWQQHAVLHGEQQHRD
jgi:hypothetical protein